MKKKKKLPVPSTVSLHFAAFYVMGGKKTNDENEINIVLTNHDPRPKQKSAFFKNWPPVLGWRKINKETDYEKCRELTKKIILKKKEISALCL